MREHPCFICESLGVWSYLSMFPGTSWYSWYQDHPRNQVQLTRRIYQEWHTPRKGMKLILDTMS
jgi:hypothetical protein